MNPRYQPVKSNYERFKTFVIHTINLLYLLMILVIGVSQWIDYMGTCSISLVILYPLLMVALLFLWAVNYYYQWFTRSGSLIVVGTCLFIFPFIWTTAVFSASLYRSFC